MPRLDGFTPLVGRIRELSVLRARLAAACNGTGGGLLLSGEAGIGKSRLVTEAADEAVAHGFHTLTGNCFTHDRSLPYAPLLDLLRGVCTGLGPDDLAQLLGPTAPELVALMPELTARLPGVAPLPLLGAEQERRRLFQALVEFFTRQAARQPLLVALEDLHWSDETSLEFLPTLIRRIEAQPILLLLTCRTHEAPPALAALLADVKRLRLADELGLAPLTPAETAAMVRAVRGDAGPPRAAILDQIYDLSEGNPFFIEEILREALVREETVHEARSGWPTIGAAEQPAVPRSIQAMVRRRVGDLSGPAREVLLLAAVAGRRVDFALLQELTGSGERELLQALRELIAAHLIVEESGDRFAFRHALTQQAVAAELLVRERRALHGRVAAALLQHAPAAGEERLADLAYHCTLAERWAEALEYGRRAGERAQALHAPRAAVEQFSRAIEAARRLGSTPAAALYRARGRAHETLGEFDLALTDLEAALDVAVRGADRRAEWQALIDLGFLWSSRNYGRTGEFFRRALALARELDDPATLGHSLNRLGNWHVNLDEPWLGLPYHEEALAIFTGLDDRRGIAETLDLIGLTQTGNADLPHAATCLDEAAALFRAEDDRTALVTCLTMRQACDHTYETATMVPAAFPDAEYTRPAREALAIARANGLRSDEPFALFMLAQSLGVRGQYATALSLAREALTIAEEMGHGQWRTGAHYVLGALSLDLLDLPAALWQLEQAVTLANEIGSLIWLRISAGQLGLACVAAGELARAEAVLDAALGADQLVETVGGRPVRLGRAALALARGEPERALHTVERLIASAPHAQETPIPRLCLLRGEVLAALNRLPEAAAALAEAEATAATLGLRPLLWRILAAAGRVHWAAGHRAAARTAFSTARRLIDELAAPLSAELRATFLRGALALLPEAPRTAEPLARSLLPDGLSPREAEVLRLLAGGHDNRAIAQTLVLSERTVEGHIANIYAKIGAAGRAARATATAYALRHGLVEA
ncbi:MAG TPA: AAA family ATPase [Dehalococcoidia bacterium]|nr:AAA family ATPase [Dehalococcoidia bacterium]